MANIVPVDQFDCVVFGGTGDLTMRKLLPALYHRFRDGQMPVNSRIMVAARSDLDDSKYRDRARKALSSYVDKADLNEDIVGRFCDRLFYVRADGANGSGFDALGECLNDAPGDIVRVFYLATDPGLYGPISHHLDQAKLITPRARVVLEKPIGHDLQSARRINDEVGAVFAEAQIFRIDHYLGKETVQNLMALRFANTMFERLWSSDAIDHVQITVAETVGVEGRGAYYDGSGG